MKIPIKNDKFEEDIVNDIKEDFLERQKDRRALEIQWELNMNFLMGNQYCDVSPIGEVEESEQGFYWQSREVFNHISPIIDTRLAKLSRVRPIMSVRAASNEDGDLKTAKLASNVLNSTYNRLNLDKVIEQATMWSETCGTAFYKIIWNNESGKIVGNIDKKDIFEGDVKVICCPPFEVFPDSLYSNDIESLNSIIHAKAMSVADIENIYGVIVEGEDIEEYTLTNIKKTGTGLSKDIKGIKKNHAIVIEKYEKPNTKNPEGKLTIVAGNKLLYTGILPYINGEDNKRIFPFIKQTCISQTGSFFGVSIIERLIPVQRAYNTVRNRKHEFLNRISMGVLTVEDGSIDTDELIEEGLSPGKVIVYRQGSRPPSMMATGSVPTDFTYEEERLSNEFILISGVSEISRNSVSPTSTTSGVALQLLIEQDDTRLTVTAENIRKCVKETAKQILRLFKQYATETRIMKMTGEGRKVEIYYFKGSDISSDDVVFDTENELSSTPAQKKTLVFDLLKLGLLADENGIIKNGMRAKILEILGYGGLDNTQDITALHINRAENENILLLKEEVQCEEYDDHETHLNEHTRFILSSELEKNNSEKIKERFKKHISGHKKAVLLNNVNSETNSENIA